MAQIHLCCLHHLHRCRCFKSVYSSASYSRCSSSSSSVCISISNSRITSPPSDDAAAANNGLKKKVLKYLPKMTYAANNDNLSDRAICLAEFAARDELRVLPQCGHGFHVECIDTWLGLHSSCPSCRRNVVVTGCQKCSGGSFPVARSSSSTESEPSDRREIILSIHVLQSSLDE